MMDAHPQRQSAKILTFPTAGRRAATNLSSKAKFAAELSRLEGMHADFGGWYHDVAIEEEQARRLRSPRPAE